MIKLYLFFRTSLTFLYYAFSKTLPIPLIADTNSTIDSSSPSPSHDIGDILKEDFHYIIRLSNVTFKKLLRGAPIPFARPRSENTSAEVCDDSNSMDDFPAVWNEQQLRNGAVVLAFVIGIYCFTLLAIICDSYFLPCVERICEALNLSQVCFPTFYVY